MQQSNLNKTDLHPHGYEGTEEPNVPVTPPSSPPLEMIYSYQMQEVRAIASIV